MERVASGTVLVDRAGATMTEVVDAIQRVTGIMHEISESSAEQALDVSQVGEAVTHMDQATQQNAALVEEMVAAAESLKPQVASASAGADGGGVSAAMSVSVSVSRRQTKLMRYVTPGAASRPHQCFNFVCAHRHIAGEQLAACSRDQGVVFNANADVVEMLWHTRSRAHVNAGLNGERHAWAQNARRAVFDEFTG